MWGFVSVMLVLLFSFIGRTQPDVDLPRYAVDRAVAANSTALPGALREDAMQISITRDGRVFFRNDRVMLVNLPEEIRKGLRDGAEKRIYLNADARVKYGDAVAVLNQIRLAGIRDVSVLTQEPYY